MTENEQIGAAFWDRACSQTYVHPYTIMFQVDDNCPVYMDDYKEWVDYFIASRPSSTTTSFVFEEQMNIQHLMPMVKLKEIHDYAMDALLCDEHGGITTA